MSKPRLTANQINALREIDEGSTGASTVTVNSLHYRHRLIERATLGRPHRTNAFALWRPTAAGDAVIEAVRMKW